MLKALLRKERRMQRWVLTLSFAAIATLATAATYQFVRSRVAVELYRDRLAAVSAEYGQLRDTYNEAIKKTAVTEIDVDNGKMCVHIRDATGNEKIINTPYDPSGEVYLDYVVRDSACQRDTPSPEPRRMAPTAETMGRPPAAGWVASRIGPIGDAGCSKPSSGRNAVCSAGS